MKTTLLVGRFQVLVLRSFAIILLAGLSTMAFAQTEIANLVDAQTAENRLSVHYPMVEANFNSMSQDDPAYAYEKARVEYTMHVYEDVQQGISTATTITTRFDEGMTSQLPQGVSLTVDEASASGAPSPAIEYDPIVAELVNLLQL